jgi:hypothetical protein
MQNVKFITQKTGHLYLGTTCPHREPANSPTPGSKVWWGHPGGDLVWGIYTVREGVMGVYISNPGSNSAAGIPPMFL